MLSSKATRFLYLGFFFFVLFDFYSVKIKISWWWCAVKMEITFFIGLCAGQKSYPILISIFGDFRISGTSDELLWWSGLAWFPVNELLNKTNQQVFVKTLVSAFSEANSLLKNIGFWAWISCGFLMCCLSALARKSASI